MKNLLKELKRIIELVDLQARMRMRAQANKMFLSYMWWVLEPLLFVSIFYIVFEVLLDRGGESFFVFLIVGQINFMWVSKGITMGANSLRQNRGIIGQRAIPKWIFPLVSVQEATYKSLIAFFIMFMILFLNGTSDPSYWWQLFPVIIVTYLFVSGSAFLVSIAVAVAEDFNQIIVLLMMGLMFCSGVFWDVSTITDSKLSNLILTINPVATFIDLSRLVLIKNQIIDFALLVPPFLISITFWCVGLFSLSKWNNKITRLLFT